MVIRYQPLVLRAGKVVRYPDVYGWAPVTREQLAAAQAVAEPQVQTTTPRLKATKATKL